MANILYDRQEETADWKDLKDKVDTAIKTAANIDWAKFQQARKLLKEAIKG